MKALPLLLLLLAATLAALAVGQVDASLGVLWEGATSGEGPGALIMETIRGPRVATALGAGAVLGLSGGADAGAVPEPAGVSGPDGLHLGRGGWRWSRGSPSA